MILKLVLVHFLKIRGTLMTRKWQHPEDFRNKTLDMICNIFQPFMLGYGPILATGEKLDKYVRNVLEHEIPLLFFCSVWRNAPAWVPKALTYFTYSRLVHGVLFTLVPVQPFRTLAYLPSYAIMAACAVFGMMLT